MISLTEAFESIRKNLPAVELEMVALTAATDRILGVRVKAPCALPFFDNSAMDGFALRASDTAGATRETPVSLALLGRVAAGDPAPPALQPGGCVRVFTGSPLPKGADAVIMQEDTAPAAGDCLLCLDTVRPWENVRFAGEDIHEGDVIGEPGDRLTAGRISLFAALGIGSVEVGRRPRVGLLALGNELCECGQALPAGGIYESNRAGLAAFLAPLGIDAIIFPLVRDTLEETRSAFKTAFEKCDVVISTGGASVGDLDFAKNAFAGIGGHLHFWQVAMKPGKPFAFGRRGERLYFGLPGNPVSAVATFLLLVKPALECWQGARWEGHIGHPGTLAEPLSNPGDRPHFIRVFVSPDGAVRPTGAQASHILGSLARANGLVEVPPGVNLPAGAVVKVLRWGW
jgi:molybdopterin molybdotransferase